MASSASSSSTTQPKLTPTNPLVSPMLTDMYQISMTYAYWKMNRHECHAVFDLFFRKNPFKGEYTIFAGLEEALALIQTFTFTSSDLTFLKTLLPHAEPAFFTYLETLDCTALKVYALTEGSVTFPRIPVLRVEGPLAVAQLLETPLLNLINYASLVSTNATRFRIAAGKTKSLLEFGLRRAQGPDGALSASRYTYMAGFDGTSNVLAGKLHGIPVRGTHAHSFVQSYTSLDEIVSPMLGTVNFKELVLKYRRQLGYGATNEGELAAFIAYAMAYNDGFLALVDTYDTLQSGVPNFLCVALALHELGSRAIGIRLDSGDLAYLSTECRRLFRQLSEGVGIDYLATLIITASNDINEPVLNALNEQGHEIDAYGIGTHLVTCQAQPALGMVYKLVSLNGTPRIKLSQDPIKVTIPGRKVAYRLCGENGKPILDLLLGTDEAVPTPGTRLLCRHPFNEMQRLYVTPTTVISLHTCVWDGRLSMPLPSIKARRDFVAAQMALMRPDVLRNLNPTPYKIAVSSELYTFIHELWMKEVPIQEMK